MGTPRPEDVPAWHWLVATGVFALGFVGLALAAVHTVSGQRADEHLLVKAQNALWPPFLREGIPLVLAALCLLLAVRAARQRSFRRLAVAGLVVGVSTFASIALQRWLDRPALGVAGYQHNTLPSDHVTVAAALTVAAVVLWDRRRWVEATAAGCVVIAAACMSSVHGFAHRPSDVVASALLVGVVTCGCLAVAATARRRRTGRGRQRTGR